MNAVNKDEDFQSSTNKDTAFDSVIGYIEDIIMESAFQETQNNFLEKYFKEFDESEENKLVYTNIFKEYTEKLEKHIETELKFRLPNFNMDQFSNQLKERSHELEGEVFELLLSFTDFLTFKELILDFKAAKEGKFDNLSFDLTVTSVKNT